MRGGLITEQRHFHAIHSTAVHCLSASKFPDLAGKCESQRAKIPMRYLFSKRIKYRFYLWYFWHTKKMACNWHLYYKRLQWQCFCPVTSISSNNYGFRISLDTFWNMMFINITALLYISACSMYSCNPLLALPLTLLKHIAVIPAPSNPMRNKTIHSGKIRACCIL